MATLGWIGLGDIGAPMAQRLIGAGHRLVVWGRSAARLQPFLDAGAIAAASPAELAAQTEAVFLCVTDGDAVEDVVFGDRGVAEGASQGSLVIDHSTIHPEETRTFAEQLRSASVGWVDAPVSGGARGAAEGTLSVFVGGNDADVALVRPWIAAYSANVTHIGPVGAGQIAKSCNQAVVGATFALWAEVIAYARRCGVDPAVIVDALAGGWADSTIRAVHGQTMVSRRFPPARTQLLLKDLEIIGDMASETGSPMPITSTATTLFRLLGAQGHGPAGPASLIRLYPDPPGETAPQ